VRSGRGGAEGATMRGEGERIPFLREEKGSKDGPGRTSFPVLEGRDWFYGGKEGGF